MVDVKPHVRIINGKKVLVNPHTRNISSTHKKSVATPVTKKPIFFTSFQEVNYEKEFHITSEEKLNELLKKIEKINKKAVKMNGGGFEVQYELDDSSEILDDFPSLQHFPVFKVNIIGKTPKIDGDYEFVGILENASNGQEPLLFGDHETLKQASANTDWSYCDKCGKKRNRKKLVVLKEKDGELYRVGGECSKDFFGYDFDINKYTNSASSIADLLNETVESSISMMGSVPEIYSPSVVMAAALHVVQEEGGYTSQLKATMKRPSTGSLVAQYLNDNRNILAEQFEEDLLFSETRTEYIQEMFDWLDNLPENETSNNQYLTNLKTLKKNNAVSLKRVGLMSSLIAAYENHLTKLEKEKQKKEETKTINNEYIGNVGDKFSSDKLTVQKIKYLGLNDYGDQKFLIEFRDPDEHIINSFTTSSQLGDLLEGEEIKVTSSKIKKHQEYNSLKQTMLSNIRFKSLHPVKTNPSSSDVSDFIGFLEENKNIDYCPESFIEGIFNGYQNGNYGMDILQDFYDLHRRKDFAWSHYIDEIDNILNPM